MQDVKINALWAYTDYPFSELGDKPYTEVPLRKILVVGYDGNKYCVVMCRINDSSDNGVGIATLSVKAGYLYKDKKRGEIPHDRLLTVGNIQWKMHGVI